jgi:hypothetical protein
VPACLPVPTPKRIPVQIDYLQAVPKSNVVTAAQKVNAAMAWMFVNQPTVAPKLGLGNCAWVLDDTAAAGGLACVAPGTQKVSTLLGLPEGGASNPSSSGRRLQQQQQVQEVLNQAASGGSSKRLVLMPANPALVVRVFADGKMRRELKGTAGQVQLFDLSTTATDLQVSWV